jgi:hypothetical protein
MISMGDDFYSLSKVGEYTFAKNIVAFRDNTSLVATVVEPVVTPWGETIMPVCAKHAPYISMDKQGNFISEEEAHYVCGILNTRIVRKYFAYTYSGRSFSINFNIKLPKFDERNLIHQNIAELAMKAKEAFPNQEKIMGIQDQIDELYLKICEHK